VSVLAAGKGGPINLDDLGLKKSYTVRNAALASPTHNDLMMEVSIRVSQLRHQEFAARYPDMAFTHIYPALIRTPMSLFKHWSLRPLNPLLRVALRPFSHSQDECAELMLYALLDGTKGAPRMAMISG